MDALERLTSFAIAMLLLSLIVEKLANFWKLHKTELRVKQNTREQEKAREMSISTATLVTGILIAFLFKADAIQILRSPTPQQVLGWDFVFAETSATNTDTTLSNMTKSYFGSLHMQDRVKKNDTDSVRTQEEVKKAEAIGRKIKFGSGIFLLAMAFVLFLMSIAMRNKERFAKIEQKRYVFITLGLFILPAIVAYILAAWADCSQQFWAYLSLFAGIVISGAGISFGSKFWHDLLDILFEVKNLWGKARDEETYRQKSRQEFDDYILSPATDDVMKLCLEQHGKSLKSIPGVTGLSVGTSERDGRKVKSLHVHLKETNVHGIANELSVDLPEGKKIKVPVEIIENVGEARVSIGPGSTIANSATPDYGGTFGCVLKDRPDRHGFRYALTCSHVLDDGRATNHLGRLLPEDNVSKQVLIFENSSSERLGTWFYGYRNNEFDVALVRLENSFQNVVNGIPLKSARSVIKNDSGKEIQLFGAKSSASNGVIVSIGEKKITYKGDQNQGDQIVTLENLIFLADNIRKEVCKAISQPGDSGAVVIDKETEEVVGMIVAADEKYSYAMSMTAILKLVAKELA